MEYTDLVLFCSFMYPPFADKTCLSDILLARLGYVHLLENATPLYTGCLIPSAKLIHLTGTISSC